MNPAKEAFEAGTQKWNEYINSLETINLCRTVLQSANHKESHFSTVDFSGATLRNCYFTNCKFINCIFTSCVFENTTFCNVIFEHCIFENFFSFRSCTLSNVFIEKITGVKLSVVNSILHSLRLYDVQLQFLAFELCEKLDCRMSESLIENITAESSKILLFYINSTGRTNANFKKCIGPISIEKTTIPILTICQCADLNLILRDVIIASINATKSESRIRIDAIQAMIFDSNIDVLDLGRSTFVSCSIVGCTWPNSEGNTDWRGKFNIPENLIAQPINDVSGISESTRQSIRRAQILASWEEASKQSRFTWLLHRLVGLSTAHGKSPLRLIVVSYGIALFEAIIGQILLHKEWMQGHFNDFQSLSVIENINIWISGVIKVIPLVLWDSVGYFFVIVSLDNRLPLELHPFFTGFSTIVGIILIGVFINLIATRISMRG
jgi:Uncharacterized low-complexity proteins